MTKYYCDICKEEIKENVIDMTLRCRRLIPNTSHEIRMHVHEKCAIALIGTEVIKELKEKEEQRKKELEERRKQRIAKI